MLQLTAISAIADALSEQLEFESWLFSDNDTLEDPEIAADIQKYHLTEQQEMRELATKAAWGIKGFLDQVRAVIAPDLVPLRSADGFLIEWVDRRTGDRPWFS